MKVDSAIALRKATGRAKSDVANKLVSMFLHEVSSRVCAAGGSSTSDASYVFAVTNAFGHNCLYCSCELEHDRVAVEHLDGMNRFRVGLHVPGNVAVACRRCNSEKRRDDQMSVLKLADSGWESFLAHDGHRCEDGCKTCSYWTTVWPQSSMRRKRLAQAQARIQKFRLPFSKYIEWSSVTRSAVQAQVEGLYRACQKFATIQIESLTSELNFDFSTLKTEKMKHLKLPGEGQS